jgi:hypothetical protein
MLFQVNIHKILLCVFLVDELILATDHVTEQNQCVSYNENSNIILLFPFSF